MNIGVMLQVLWLRRAMLRRDRWTREQLAAYQARRLRSLRAHAHAHSSFYRDFHAGLADRLVVDPNVRLAEVEAHIATLRGDEQFRGRYQVCATSGSTGRRGFFLFDRREWAEFLASWARGHEWSGYPAGPTHRMRLASVASTAPWHMSVGLPPIHGHSIIGSE